VCQPSVVYPYTSSCTACGGAGQTCCPSGTACTNGNCRQGTNTCP
jgi:hypothetical protein